MPGNHDSVSSKVYKIACDAWHRGQTLLDAQYRTTTLRSRLQQHHHPAHASLAPTVYLDLSFDEIFDNTIPRPAVDFLHLDRWRQARRNDQQPEQTKNGCRDASDGRRLRTDECTGRYANGPDHEGEREAQKSRNEITTLGNSPEHDPPITNVRVSNRWSLGQVRPSKRSERAPGRGSSVQRGLVRSCIAIWSASE